MATFTMDFKEVVEKTDGHIGLDTYPIFDESYREKLNQKIIDHYWNHEIGQETIDMFILAMRRKMNEIMPYYNQLYESELLKFDPLETFRTSTETTQTGTSETQSQGTNNSTSVGKSRTVASDTPQTRLAGNEDYASSAQDSASDSEATGTASDESTAKNDAQSEVASHGFTGSPSALLQTYRETFLNIDMGIIDDLGILFMQVWSDGDEFSLDAFTRWPLFEGR